MITSFVLGISISMQDAAKIANTASNFKSEVFFIYTHKKINCKSMLGIMSLGAKEGEEVCLLTEGEDEEVAASQLIELLTNN